jgi:hypothetical protein
MKKRKHHDVWRYYLKPWTTDGSIFCLRAGKVFPSGLMGVANRRDFYKMERLSKEEVAAVKRIAVEPLPPHLQVIHQRWLDIFDIPFRAADVVQASGTATSEVMKAIDALKNNIEEELHARIESGAINNLNALRNKDATFFDNDYTNDSIDFLHFICIQHLRTAKMQHALLEAAVDLGGLRLDRMWKVLRHLFAWNVAGFIYSERAHWRLIFLDNASDNPFVTGDQPIVNTYAVGQPLDYEPTLLEFYYPVSPRVAVLLSRRSDVPNGTCLMLSVEEVDRYNCAIVQSSYEQVYASSAEILEHFSA